MNQLLQIGLPVLAVGCFAFVLVMAYRIGRHDKGDAAKKAAYAQFLKDTNREWLKGAVEIEIPRKSLTWISLWSDEKVELKVSRADDIVFKAKECAATEMRVASLFGGAE